MPPVTVMSARRIIISVQNLLSLLAATADLPELATECELIRTHTIIKEVSPSTVQQEVASRVKEQGLLVLRLV